MRRASKIHKFEVLPDARFNNVLVTRFVNALMIQGKKSVAERIFYGAVDIIEKKIGSDGLSVVKSALANVKPVLEVKSRRVGGATYQVPVEVRQDGGRRSRFAGSSNIRHAPRSHDGGSESRRSSSRLRRTKAEP